MIRPIGHLLVAEDEVDPQKRRLVGKIPILTIRMIRAIGHLFVAEDEVDPRVQALAGEFGF